MKVLFTGGGTGGHFYPLIAVARALYRRAEAEHIARVEIVLMADTPFEEKLLKQENISFVSMPAGKVRRYFSLLNIVDGAKTLVGIVWSFFKLYSLLPDIVFSKGGYAAFPTLIAARALHIPVIIHESDSIPGKVNQWSGKWAARIAVSFPDTVRFFNPQKTIVSGNPIREEVLRGNEAEALDQFNLESGIPTILILGGSQGSEKINETILSILPTMLEQYQVIHQTGKKNFDDVKTRARVILENIPLRHRYHVYPYLYEGDLRNAAKAAMLVVSRSGSNIFEIAAWGLPSILIPIPHAAQDHQRKNAYQYARTGACVVLEEGNLTPNVLLSEIGNIVGSSERQAEMKKAALNFARPDAADVVARQIVTYGVHD